MYLLQVVQQEQTNAYDVTVLHCKCHLILYLSSFT